MGRSSLNGLKPIERRTQVSLGSDARGNMRGENVRVRLTFPYSPTLPLLLIAASVTLGAALTIRTIGPLGVGVMAVALMIIAVVALRLDEVMVLIIIVGCVVIDWYRLVDFSILRFPIVAPTLASLLIGVMLVSRSQARMWIPVPNLWLWSMLLILVVPAIARVIPTYYPESLVFYGLQLFVTPLLLYIVGVQLGHTLATIRHILAMITGFGTLVAAHTILVALTGTFLFETQHEADYLGVRGNFVFTESDTARVGSFLLNPDWNGTFLMMMACITAGLFVESTSPRARLIYATELALILPALFFTYSLAALAAAGFGVIVLIVVVGRPRQLIGLFAVVGLAIAAVAVAFPAQLDALQQHASSPREGAFRLGAWLTALRVIAAHPITGIGLSQFTYLQRAEPYRVPMEFLQESHPHESYLELAAMGGIPLAAIFLALVGAVMWEAVRGCRCADKQHRPLLGGALAAVAALAFNSLAINAWTLPPLAALAWLILGLLSSPIRTRCESPSSHRFPGPVVATREHPPSAMLRSIKA